MQTVSKSNSGIYIEYTEVQAFNFLKDNVGIIQKAFKEKRMQFKSLEDLRNVLTLSLLLGVKQPASKNNEITSIIEKDWDFFRHLGVVKTLTYTLSYRAVNYLLRLFDFDFSLNKESEEEAYKIIYGNREKIEESLSPYFSIHDIKSVRALARLFKMDLNYAKNGIYAFIQDNWDALLSLGCSKRRSFILNYTGVLYLIKKRGYPIDLTKKEVPTTSTPKVVRIKTTKVEDKKEITIPLVKRYLVKKRKELEKVVKKYKVKTEANSTRVKATNEVIFLLERAESIMNELGMY